MDPSKAVDTKTTLRQLMKQEKQKRIDSPLAKYTNTGQLFCALCNQQLVSETFWKAHINGREHTKKVAELKSNIKQSSNEAVFAKPLPPSPVNVAQQRGVKRSHDAATSDNPTIISKSSTAASSPLVSQHSALPADFFDANPGKTSMSTGTKLTSTEKASALPEGFFDDPQLDARMRKVEYVNKMEVEWDAFTREMKQETSVSEKIEVNDDIDRDAEREIEETDELISRWQKIEDMHNIKDNRFKVKKQLDKVKQKQTNDDDDDETLEKELESMYNWRQKRS